MKTPKVIDKRVSVKLSDKLNINTLEMRSYVIVTINQFEDYCAKILMGYFEPNENKKGQFFQVLMNGSIIGFGSKVKVMRSLSIIDEDEFSRLMQLANIRNGFAHALHYESIESKNQEDSVIEIQHSLNILNNKGEIEVKNMKEWFEIFMDKSDYFLHWLPEIYNEYYQTGMITLVTKEYNYRKRSNDNM